ncbi:MAG: general secretion pathway protein GspB [Gallionella sp.]|nr:general secretion pathway protein GspB [Gallionella sp.]
MSYILEALKKSDQQRQRGTTPTLSSAQLSAVEPRKAVHYGGWAAVLLVGIAIGWLQPWQTVQTTPVAITAPAPPQLVPAPLQKIAEDARPTPVQKPISAALAAPAINTPQAHSPVLAAELSVPASAPIAEKTKTPAPVPPPLVAPLAELPPALRQEIPAMNIQVHSYSGIPAHRLVSINNRMLHEGESLTPGLKLEQITEDGVIFSYKGYRVPVGIR